MLHVAADAVDELAPAVAERRGSAVEHAVVAQRGHRPAIVVVARLGDAGGGDRARVGGNGRVDAGCAAAAPALPTMAVENEKKSPPAMPARSKPAACSVLTSLRDS